MNLCMYLYACTIIYCVLCKKPKILKNIIKTMKQWNNPLKHQVFCRYLRIRYSLLFQMSNIIFMLIIKQQFKIMSSENWRKNNILVTNFVGIWKNYIMSIFCFKVKFLCYEFICFSVYKSYFFESNIERRSETTKNSYSIFKRNTQVQYNFEFFSVKIKL